MDQQNHNHPMQTGKTTCACGAGCNCGCGYRSGYHVLRWVLGFFILFFVFAVGVKLGEFITEFRSYMSYNRMDSGMMMDRQIHGYNPGGPMIPATGATPVTGSPVTQ
jgi:hypothetical protein